MAHEMRGLKLAILLVGLLIMVPETTQLNVDHKLYNAVQRLNQGADFSLGLVVSSERYEKALLNSSYFTPDSSIPSLTISGRKFNIGEFKGVPAVYVLAGKPLANVGVTVQILLDTFRVSGIINFGGAAAVSDKVSISDVVVPSEVAYTGAWKWQKHESSSLNDAPGLKFGDYNLPEAGENSLASIQYRSVPIYTPTSSKQKNAMWINVYSEWVKLASKINFGQQPKVHIGPDIKVGSSDVYLSNEAYGEFLGSQLGVSAVDSECAAVVTTSIANGVPHIVFRGSVNKPGLAKDESKYEVTAKHVLKTVAQFVNEIYPRKKYSIVYQA